MSKKKAAKKLNRRRRQTRDAVDAGLSADTQRTGRDALLHPVSQVASPMANLISDAIKKISEDP